MSDYVVPVFVEAKMEYTQQLVNIVKPHIFEGLKSIYDESCEICIKKGNIVKVTIVVFGYCYILIIIQLTWISEI